MIDPPNEPPLRFKTKEEIENRPRYRAGLIAGLDDLAKIVGGYEFDPDHAISCGLNKCNTKHQNGYVIATKSGDETVCGNICGKNAFDVSFVEMRERFVSKIEEQGRIDTVKRIQADANRRLEGAMQLARDVEQAYRKVMSVRNAFRVDATIERQLQNLMRTGGEIRVRVEQTEAEKMINRGSEPKANMRTIGRVRGTAALGTYARAMNAVEDEVVKVIESIRRIDMSKVTKKEIAGFNRQIDNLPAATAFVQEFLADATALLTGLNLNEFGKMEHLDGVSRPKFLKVIVNIAENFEMR